MAELLSLFKGQWKNGMLPHIIFHNPSNDHFPDAKDWKIDLSNDSPKGIHTSDIIQPPIHATVVWNIYNNAEDKKIDIENINIPPFKRTWFLGVFPSPRAERAWK